MTFLMMLVGEEARRERLLLEESKPEKPKLGLLRVALWIRRKFLKMLKKPEIFHIILIIAESQIVACCREEREFSPARLLAPKESSRKKVDYLGHPSRETCQSDDWKDEETKKRKKEEKMSVREL